MFSRYSTLKSWDKNNHEKVTNESQESQVDLKLNVMENEVDNPKLLRFERKKKKKSYKYLWF